MTLASSNICEEARARSPTPAVWRLCVIMVSAVAAIMARSPQIGMALIRRDRAARYRVLGEAAAGAAESLGPVFIKAAQMLSYRTDLLPVDFLRPLEKLQDRVRPPRPDETRRAVEASLGRPVHEIFAAFEDKPVACGSVAVVCRATGHNGQSLAVKVVRPGVKRQIARDLDCLRWLLTLAARSRAGRGVPIIETYDLIATMIAMQGDMRAEGRSLSRFGDLLAMQPRVTTPSADYQAATADVLVMQFVDAVAWRQIDISNVAFKRAANDLLITLYNMIFKLGIVHCDMHPGNILLQQDGTVVVIDAGLVVHLSEHDMRCFRYLFLALAFNSSSGFAASILESALMVPDDLDRPAFERDVEALVKSFHGRKAGEFLVADFVFRIFDIQRRHRIFGPPGFAGAIWALVMFEGLVRARYPDLDFQAVARPFALRLNM
jgi:ubiquinone biosynthesis protein